MSLMKRIGRVGLQKRYFKYDGRPQTELAPEGEKSGTGTVLTIGAVVGSLIVLNWYQTRDLVLNARIPGLYQDEPVQLFAPIPPIQPAPPDRFPIPSVILFLRDLCNPHLIRDLFLTGLKYHNRSRELLYQMRIELGVMLLEFLNGWEISWIIPL